MEDDAVTSHAATAPAAGDAVLPGPELVGSTTSWLLPAGREHVSLVADFIGWASSRRDAHERHDPGTYAAIKTSCRACRWFESRLFREVPDPERYLLHTAGLSTVPGEVTFTRCEWAHSGEEVVNSLAMPYTGDPVSCPVCRGQGLVSRPPGVAGDVPAWAGTETGPYRCMACRGRGVLLNGGLRFTVPAQRMLSQAASFDDEIRDAWRAQLLNRDLT